MNPTAAESIQRARALLAEHDIDVSRYKCVFKSLHPQVADDQIELGILMEVASFTYAQPPYTVDSVAEQMANRAGAFAWQGPVGNGFTMETYRNKFREYARDQLFLMRQLGLCEPTA
ncbi:hypothetical protein [Nocardia sp. IFM 10818]